ncbi:MAG: hypothetical protein F9K19_25235 [Rhizobiaceae bacterium]|nr:MAG: hypothetical protein F9K19_25235 [Rhizobiaceae bacterium]
MNQKPRPLLMSDINLIHELVFALAIEIDLHYDDEDLHALCNTFGTVEEGVRFLKDVGSEVHPDILQIVGRFHRHRN